MLHTLNDLTGFSINATDGKIGAVKDCYFDDKQWVIRYFIVETGTWLGNRKVLLSPISIKYLNLEEKTIALSITMNQVKNSPQVDTHQPISQQYEIDYLSYYGYPAYWGNAGFWGAYASPAMIASGSAASLLQRNDDLKIADTFVAAQSAPNDLHLRSCNDTIQYQVQALDGELGHLHGLLVDEDTWAVRYFIVSTGNWWLGHQVLMAPSWIKEINWIDAKISVDMTRQQLKSAPIFDPGVPLSRQKELGIHRHYNRPGYWESYIKTRHAS